MILIDATFVASYGGINVLKTLIDSIENNEKKLFILFVDIRLKHLDFDIENFKRVLYVRNRIIERQLIFLEIEPQIKVVLSFGNVPLIVSKNIYQITFVQQYFVFNGSKINDLKLKIRWIFKGFIIRTLFKFTKSDIAVQTRTMALLANKINSGGKTYIFPIFKPLTLSKKLDKTPTNFIYISSAHSYKKIDFLIDAFNNHNEKHKDSVLYLTIEDENIFKRFNKSNNKNIINLGYVENNLINKILNSSYNMVHPSLAESFGLVLLEASFNGNAIIAPEMSYVYDVCEPSLTYNRHSLESLINALDVAVKKPLPPAKPLVQNKSRELILFLINKLHEK